MTVLLPVSPNHGATVSDAPFLRPGAVERGLAIVTMFVLMFGLPFNWLVTSQELRTGGGRNELTTLAILALIGLSSLRILGSIDLVLRIISIEPLLFAFVGYMTLSTVWSIDLYLTFRYALLLILFTTYAVYLLMRFEIAEIVGLMVRVAILGAVVNFAWVFGMPQYGVSGSGEWSGIFGQKNALGFSAAMIIPSALLFARAVPRRRFEAYFATLCWVVLLVGSQSKTMLVATGATTALMVLYAGFRSRRTLRGAVMVGLFGSTIVSIAFATANIGVIAGWLGKDVTLTGRTILWSSLMDPIREAPVFGYGYSVAFTDPLGPLFEVFARNTWGVSHAHNAALQLLLDGGIIALMLYLGFYVRGVLRSIELTKVHTGLFGLWPLVVLSSVLMVSVSEPGVVGGGFGWLMQAVAVLYAGAYRPRGPASEAAPLSQGA